MHEERPFREGQDAGRPAGRRADARPGRKRMRRRHWRNVVTMDAMLDRLRMIADKMLRPTDEGRADFLAQMSAAAA